MTLERGDFVTAKVDTIAFCSMSQERSKMNSFRVSSCPVELSTAGDEISFLFSILTWPDFKVKLMG